MTRARGPGARSRGRKVFAAKISAAETAAANPERLDLDRFFPYRLSVTQLAVSRALAQIYGARFNLSRHEWRVLAALGGGQPLTGNGVAQRTSMDKVQVSRAVGRLIAGGLVARGTDNRDRRRAVLRLTRKGEGVYRKVVPLVKARERELLSALTRNEIRVLEKLVAKLHGRARDLLGET